MEGDQESRSSRKGLVKRVVAMVTLSYKYLQKIGAETKSCPAGCFSAASQRHEAQIQEQTLTVTINLQMPVCAGHDDAVYTEGASQDDAEASLVLLDDRFKSIPEELLERILAMVPFPEVGKARVLSKSWQARFLPVESHDDEEKKHLAVSFQKQVRDRSIKWRPFCPIFFNMRNQSLFAYDSASHNWPKMPSLSFLPAAVTYFPILKAGWYPARENRIVLNRRFEQRNRIKCLELVDGTLFLAATVTTGEDTELSMELEEGNPLTLHVANLLTQTWRHLPQAPLARVYAPFVKLVSQPALEKYKVIVFYSGNGYFFAQCYDSRSAYWRSTTGVHISDGIGDPTHLDGLLYMKVGYEWTRLLAFNVEEETFEELELVGVRGRRSSFINLVVCSGNLLMIVQDESSRMTVQVLKIDVGSREVSELARGPPAAVTLGRCTWISTECHSDGVTSLCFRLYCRIQIPGMVAYNMRTDAWHYVALPWTDWLPSSFQTNINPFLTV